jgi:Holliday junction resolvase-like predicted endonuclease
MFGTQNPQNALYPFSPFGAVRAALRTLRTLRALPKTLLAKLASRLRPTAYPPPHSPQALGLAGERYAQEHLEQQGLRIIARRWRSPGLPGEIDLIARDPSGLWVFAEVKTRSPGTRIPGYYAATQKHKKATLRAMIKAFRARHPGQVKAYRFDVLQIKLGPELKPDILHYRHVCLN